MEQLAAAIAELEAQRKEADSAKSLYEVLLGQSEGPRFGSFIALYGIADTRALIEQGLALNLPDPNDPLDVLAKVGGLEIAALAGLVLGSNLRA